MRNRDLSRTLAKAVPLLLLVWSVRSVCPAKSTITIADDFSKECKPCPSNCAICYLGPDRNPICAFCDDGFFMDKEKTCRSCSPNCTNCIGPDLNQCRHVANGFFYDSSTNVISPCKDSACATCNAADACVSCKEGFFVANRTAEANATDSVTCQTCGIDNCLYCGQKDDQVKDATYLTCTLCKAGFGVVSGKCEKCPDNCLYCHEESKECTFCETGFYLQKASNTCAKIQIDNCYSLADNGDCLFCESHFYLKDGKCVPCKGGMANCSYCTTKSDSITCLSCEIGFYLAGDACKPCPENCNHCSSERCFVCSNGNFYNQATAKCEPCTIDKCELCKSADVCDTCLPGFYFDTKAKACQP